MVCFFVNYFFKETKKNILLNFLVVGRCGAVPFVENAMISSGQSSVGAVRTFTCNDGYMLVGTSIVQCTPDHHWRIEGSCIIETCNEVPYIQNGRVFGGSNKIGAKRRVICNHGYGMTGYDVIECTLDRQWKIETSCIPVSL